MTTDDTPIGLFAGPKFNNSIASTCAECGILRIHIAQLERDLAAEVRRLKMGLDGEVDFTHQVEAERDAARAEAARLRELLREAQWAAMDDSDYQYCFKCEQYKDRGHGADCPIRIALEKRL